LKDITLVSGVNKITYCRDGQFFGSRATLRRPRLDGQIYLMLPNALRQTDYSRQRTPRYRKNIEVIQSGAPAEVRRGP